MTRRLRRVGGTPIEEAPLWVLAIFTGLLWRIVFPAPGGPAQRTALAATTR